MHKTQGVCEWFESLSSERAEILYETVLPSAMIKVQNESMYPCIGGPETLEN